MKRLTTNQDVLRALCDPKRVIEVPIPETGQDVCVLVRMLTAGERDDLECKLSELRQQGAREHMRNFRARACSYFLSDEKRQAIFSEEDVEELTEGCSSALDRIYDAGRFLNRMFLSDREEAEEKKTPGALAGASCSGSPASSASPSAGSEAISTPTS